MGEKEKDDENNDHDTWYSNVHESGCKLINSGTCVKQALKGTILFSSNYPGLVCDCYINPLILEHRAHIEDHYDPWYHAD